MNYESRAIALLNHKYGEGAVIAKVFTEKYGLKSFSIKRNKSKKSKNKILLLDKMSLLTINAKNNSKKEIQYLIRSVNNYLEKQISAKDIVDSYSGIRPLIEDFNQASKVTRDYIFDLNIIKKLPLLSIYGGKLTTYRKLAENVLLDLKNFLPKTKIGPWTHKKNLF